jgi:tetratricopeptide (TPR) repeat protein
VRIRPTTLLCGLAVSVALSVRAAPSQADADQPKDGPAVAAALRRQGLERGYNLDHAGAIAAFKEAIAADPGDPAGYRLLAGATWTIMVFNQGAITVDDFLGQARADLPRPTPTDALAASFHDAANRALALSEQRLQAHPDDIDARYQVGAASEVIASYTATIEGRILGSVGTARRAYREHERVLNLDPRRKDAGLIVGLYSYAVAALPMPLRVMANLAGFSGGRDRALRLVEEAARFPSEAQPGALFSLVLIYNREARFDDALRLIGELQRRYPRNRLLWLEAGGTAMRAGRPLDAKSALEEGIARLAHDPRPRAPGEEARWRYAYGAALVALNDGAAAEPQLRLALDGAARDWVRGRVHKELGKLADRSGNRPRALDEYQMASRLCRQDHDAECSEDVKRLLK